MIEQSAVARLLKTGVSRASQSAVAWSLLATVFRAASAALLLPLMVRKVPSDHLGLWYVFLSLQGIASLFDLGFSPAVTRAAGYVWGGARELRKFGVAAEQQSDRTPNVELLRTLVASMRSYYRLFGLVSGVVMLVIGGAWVWYKTQGMADATTLRWGYALFLIGGFLNATGDLWPALLSGINGVRAAQKILTGAALVNLLLTGIGLISNLGVWALVLGSIGSGLFIRTSGRFSFLRLSQLTLAHVRPKLELIAQLWPMAWRSGLVRLGGFLVLSANTLICSAFLTLSTTASYGLSVSIIAMLTYASSTFTQIKLPLVNQMRAAGQTNEIVELWIQRTRLSLVFYVVGAAGLILLGNPALHFIGAKTFLLPSGQLALALLIIGLEMHHVLYGDLVVSENLNPFVWPALLSGGATLLLSLLLTPYIGVWGMLLAQGIAQASFNNWWTVYRGVRGLGLSWGEYWNRYARTPVRI